MKLASLASLSLAVAALSGCADTGDAEATTTGTATGGVRYSDTSYSILLTSFNGQSSPQLTQSEEFTWPTVANGTRFTYTIKVEGSAGGESDHIGGHFGRTSSPSQANTTIYNIGCDHVAGHLPGTFDVTCTAPAEPGTYHLRGHARIMQDGQPVNWWSEEFHFRIV